MVVKLCPTQAPSLCSRKAAGAQEGVGEGAELALADTPVFNKMNIFFE